jgi:hypothetical protein
MDIELCVCSLNSAFLLGLYGECSAVSDSVGLLKSRFERAVLPNPLLLTRKYDS